MKNLIRRLSDKIQNYNSKFKIFIFCLVILFSTFLFLNFIYAATNIDSTYRYGWNDLIGWIDFYSTNNVYVYFDRIEGYASSSVGSISFNCNSTPNGNICSGPAGNWKVANNGSGNLTGWAYNDNIGWISFSCLNEGVCALNPNYQVVINNSTGYFSGWAYNDNIGWISFNCNDSGAGGCGSDYKVKTNWSSAQTEANLISSIFDTQSIGGAAINTIMWQGSQPNGTSVKFQIASSNNSNGPWDYKGPGGSNVTYYSPSGPDSSSQINLAYHNNHRYFRYKIFLYSNAAQTDGPQVSDVIINWSP
ncbi:MAG: hypothetical protein AAB396_00350 [Patescibacteria group bacterium]